MSNDNDLTDPQIAAYLSLRGVGTATQAETYGYLVRALRSTEPLSADLREAMAEALDAATTGEKRVRLRVEAPEGYFKSLSTLAANKRLLETGWYLETERGKGRTYKQAGEAIEGIEDVAKYSNRARKFYARFLAFLASDHPDAQYARTLAGNHDPIENEDARTYGFSRFSELESGLDD